MTDTSGDDIVLKFLHTADWHLGRSYPSFGEEQAKKLTRARLEVLERILGAAERFSVDAVLCAGDLFDDARPDREWWEQAANRFQKRKWTNRPVFLLPGNHDPFTPESVWAKEHEFRRSLPAWVHVVDRSDFEFKLSNDAVLYAVPCTSKSGANDPTESIPRREPGDERIRLGMVHGSTFDMPGCQTNFPIAIDAVLARGLDYLAIGDTHGFRFVPPERRDPPTIYPGTPEPTAFNEKDPGSVAVVFMNRRRLAKVRAERVAHWTWEVAEITSMEGLRQLARRPDLADRVLRLRVKLRASAPEYEEAERLLTDLEGTPARHGRVGVLDLDRQELQLDSASVHTYCTELPEVLRSTVKRLQAAAQDPATRLTAERALYHLYRTSRTKVA